MRCYGDIGPLPMLVWRAGLMDTAPDVIEHGVVGVAGGLGRNGWGAAILMRDLSDSLFPPGYDPISADDHVAILNAMATLGARAWEWSDGKGLLPYDQRWMFFGPDMIEAERALGYPTPVPKIAAEGWELFDESAAPGIRALIRGIQLEQGPFLAALHTTPSTFLHGDWKLGNVGRAADGRVVLIDWSYCGAGPVCYDLAWHLALNRARIPHSKEETCELFRQALEARGIGTADWFDRQLSLCLLGALVQLGWEKALGDADELDWWCERALAATRHLK